MAKKDNQNIDKNVTDFRISRVKTIQDLYSDEPSTRRRFNQNAGSGNKTPTNAAAVRTVLEKSLTNRDEAVRLSQQLYAKNPIYSAVINYMSNMFMWRYKVTPHKVFKKSKAKLAKKVKEDDYMLLYSQMLEVVDGLSIPTKFPALLSRLFVQGSTYFTTYCDDQSITIDTLLLPDKYCRKIGETQYGTAIIQYDFSYFDDLGLTSEQLTEYLKSFPKEFKQKYFKYKKDTNLR